MSATQDTVMPNLQTKIITLVPGVRLSWQVCRIF